MNYCITQPTLFWQSDTLDSKHSTLNSQGTMFSTNNCCKLPYLQFLYRKVIVTLCIHRCFHAAFSYMKYIQCWFQRRIMNPKVGLQMGVQFNFVLKQKETPRFAECLHKIFLTQNTQTLIAGASRPDEHFRAWTRKNLCFKRHIELDIQSKLSIVEFCTRLIKHSVNNLALENNTCKLDIQKLFSGWILNLFDKIFT